MNRLQPYYLVLGEILRPHGIRGELKMRVFTDYPERLIKDVKTIYLGSDPKNPDADAYRITAARFHKEYLLLRLKEIPTRNDAELLRGKLVMIDIDNAVPLADGEYYMHELIGLQVQTSAGDILGIIKDVLETGANDVYIVKSRQYGDLLLPAHDETIANIDFDAEMVTMDLPDGIIPSKENTD